MTLPRIVEPAIDPRFVNELPRFFGGWLPTLREIFQNAYRAGATEVHVTTSATQLILTIADNGRGCPDVEALMMIGRSDWNEGLVVEAAGMGFISVLNGALIEHVTARSANWRAEWQCQRKALAPATVYEAEPVPGFLLTLVLNQTHDLAADIQAARAFYPFVVTLNGVVVEPLFVEHDVLLETAVGPVYWKQGSYAQSADFTAVWEHRDLKSGAFAGALTKALQQQPREFRPMYEYYPRFTWFVDPACGVRPKLPDRNDLQDDVHLAAAARIIAQAFCERVFTAVKNYSATLPAVVAGRDIRTPLKQLNAEAVIAILINHLGWSRLREDEFQSMTVTWENSSDGPGTYPMLDSGEMYDVLARTDCAIPIRQSDVPTLANWLALTGQMRGLRVVDDDDPAARAIEIQGQRCKTANSYVAQARDIVWEGFHIPFYLNPQGTLDVGSEPLLVLAGSVRQMLRTYEATAETFLGWWLTIASDAGGLAEWCDEEYDEWQPAIDRIADAYRAAILEYGTPTQRQAQTREVATRALLTELHTARQAVAAAIEHKAGQKPLDERVARLLKQTDDTIKLVVGEQKRLAGIVAQFISD